MNSPGVTLEKQALPISLENLEKLVDQMDETDLELFPFFEEEAKAELKTIEASLHAWHGRDTGCPLEQLRVQLHTLKGAANSIGQLRIGSLAGGLKEVLDSFSPADLLALRPEVTKVCVMVLEAIKVLMKEARAPQYNPVKREFLLKVVQSILDLKKKEKALKPL